MKRLKWLVVAGYVGSGALLVASLILITASGPLGYDFDSPPPPLFGDYRAALLNRNDIDSAWYPISACVLIHNGDTPYFGSVMGLPSPTSEIDIRDWGVYLRYFTWTTGKHWLTLQFSLWWLVIASLLFPASHLIVRRRCRVRLHSILAAIAVEAAVLSFLPSELLTHPAVLLFNAAAVVLGVGLMRFSSRLLWGPAQDAAGRPDTPPSTSGPFRA